ncbi:MAG: signal peptide peptidase SppA [Candidatus Bostrichicola ureolyticus]|nr:MAG: signal peptide peptidase SppA [Candidatus Bostrichicola ureolyticus]
MKNIIKYAFCTILTILGLIFLLNIIYNKKIKFYKNNVLQINSNIDNLLNTIEAIKYAQTDKNIKGIIFEADSNLIGSISNIKNIRDALKEFKKSKKFIYSYGNNISQSAYYLCSVADLIFLNPLGQVNIKGLSLEQTFYKKLIKKIGAKFYIFRHGKYKSAVEPFLYTKISNENREQYTKLLNYIWNFIVNDISESRHLSKKTINLITNELYGINTELSYKYKIIDKIAYYDEFIDAIKNKLKSNNINFISIKDYLKFLSKQKKTHKNKIAIIYASGLIKQGVGTTDIQDKNYEFIINNIINDKSIKSVVLRINSTGGDAIASDNIFHKLILLKRKKPLIVSVGDYATSGGYYIALAGDKIIASPISITGSIGVFGMMVTFKGLIDKLGLTKDNIVTNNNSIPISLNNIKKQYKNIIFKNIEFIYDKFISNVSKERKISKYKINEIAQGKILSGNEALKKGLIDSLGSLNDAIKIAAKIVNIKDYSIVNFPIKKESFIKMIINKFFLKNNNKDYNNLLYIIDNLKNLLYIISLKDDIKYYTYTNISIK